MTDPPMTGTPGPVPPPDTAPVAPPGHGLLTW